MAWTPAPGEAKTHLEFLIRYFSDKQPTEPVQGVAVNIILIAAGVRPCYLLYMKTNKEFSVELQRYFDTSGLPLTIVPSAESGNAFGVLNTFICTPREVILFQQSPELLGFLLGYQCFDIDFTTLGSDRQFKSLVYFRNGIRQGILWKETCELRHLIDSSKKRVWEAIVKTAKKILGGLGFDFKYEDSGGPRKEASSRELPETKSVSAKVYQTLLGPISLTEHYSEKYRKRVYVFGDRHRDAPRTKKGEIGIDRFVSETVLANPDKIIDFFIELDMPDNPGGRRSTSTTDSLGRLAITFNLCLTKSKEICNYPNLRAHYVDIRDTRINDPYSEFQNIKEGLSRMRAHAVRNMPDLLNRLKILFQKETEIFKDPTSIISHFQKLFSKLKIQKQLDNIGDPEVKGKLLISFDNCVAKPSDFLMKRYSRQNILEVISRVLAAVVEGKYDYNDADSSTLRYYLRFHETLETCLMDLYLMSRFFREFDKKNSNHPSAINYAIIYTGNHHSGHYRKLLNHLGFDLVNEARNDGQCLDISKFKQPFFH